MSNKGLELALAGMGARLVRTRVGDRYVVEEMRRHGYNFGGEQSGHLIFLDSATTGDGVIAGLELLAVMRETGRPLSELKKIFTPLPQTQVNLPIKRRRELDELPGVLKAIKKAEQRLGREGRVLVRFSGTELKVRVLVEGPDRHVNEGLADQMVGELEQALC